MSAGVASCGRRCRSMSVVLAAVTGAIFGGGLLLAGMTRPERVIGFLDVAGAWDPSLAFVMGGALVVFALSLRLVLRRRRDPWFDVTFHLPTRRDVDTRLLAGAAIFGVGWGLGGLCPGPGLVAAGSATPGGVVFVLAMIAGMAIQRRLTQPIGVHSSTSTPSGSRT